MKPAPDDRLPVLDGLRGSAILLVLVYHLTILSPACGLDAAFRRVARFGWCGVDLFFVLSGFLITGILLDSKSRPRYFRNFYARRTLRIFPLYYAVLFFAMFVLPRFFVSPTCDPALVDRKGLYWLYLSNVAIALQGVLNHDILDVTWSLSVEEQFYLVWPLVVLWLPAGKLKRLCGALIAAVCIFRTVLVLRGVGPLPIYVLTPMHLDALAAGGLLAAVAREPGGLSRFAPLARRMGFLSGVLVILLWALPNDFEFVGNVMQEFGYTALAVFFGSLLVASVTAAPATLLTRFMTAAPMRTLGKYSYAIYLFHYPVHRWIRAAWLGEGNFPLIFGSRLPAQFLFFALSGSATFLLALLSWNLLEKHFLKLKRFFVPEGAPAYSRSTSIP